MKHLKTFVIALLVVIVAALSASCGGSSIGVGQPQSIEQAGQQNTDEQINLDELPAFPLDEEGTADDSASQARGVSWLSHPNHLTPAWNVLGAIDPGDPGCYLLQGQKINFGAKSIGYLAAAMYKIPVGALEPDLLDMKVAAQIGAPTDTYYTAIANFTAMHWQFSGPLNSPSWYTDMTSLGYDFTGPGGNMYIVLIALPGQSLHITDITLNFKDGEKPDGNPNGDPNGGPGDGSDDDGDVTWWNVWGEAYNNYSTLDPYASKLVTFENLGTGVVYSTITAANGHWGMNLPTGHYIFNVQDSEVLMDVSAVPAEHIDYLYDGGSIGLKVDLNNTGQIVYMDDRADYFGSVVPMPLITAAGY